MPRGRNQIVFRSVRTLFDVGAVGGLTDGELLDRFEGSPGEVAELAFAVLVERHGPMVLRACRKILRDEHAAQDAFQATFLVLARKGGTVRRRDTLGPWLHGVACRVAACARAVDARRRRRERDAADLVKTSAADPPHDDFGPAIHEEINRLPERYRSPIVLCCLEGITREQAALRLGWRVGTVSSRLARGRERLKERLMRRGIAPAVGTVAAALAGEAEAALLGLPTRLVEATMRFGIGYTAGHASSGTVPAGVAALLTGVFRAMFLQKLKATATAAAALALVGVGISWGQQPGEYRTREYTVGREKSDESPGTRLDEIEKKLDRLITVLERSQGPSDPRSLTREVTIANELFKAAKDRSDWAGKMHEKGYVSEGQAAKERIAVLEAEQALGRAKARLADAEANGQGPKAATVVTYAVAPSVPVPPGIPRIAEAPRVPTMPPMAPMPPAVVAPPAPPRLREVDNDKVDRLERRLDALERRLDALESRPDGSVKRFDRSTGTSSAAPKP